MQAGEPRQAITAIGQIKSRERYAFDMGGGFVPMRRDVDFKRCVKGPIRPLVGRLSFIRNKHSWGYVFRFARSKFGRQIFKSL